MSKDSSSQISPHFWPDKKVFLTGHTGFKGGWLSLWLQSLGANVTGFSLNPASTPNLFGLASVADGMTSYICDIRELNSIKEAVQKAKPEIIFHLAAQPLVRYSYENPVETYATNIMGTVNLLEAVRNTPSIKAVVIVTTDKCYENREWIWPYRENEPMGGHDPYSSSKGCAELVTAAFRSSYFHPKEYQHHGVGIATARAGNVIGGGDWSKDRLVPDILAAINANVPVHLRNPWAIRPWQHVLEPLSGYLKLAELLYSHGATYAEAWNFGPEERDCISVKHVAENLVTLLGGSVTLSLDSIVHCPHEANLLKLDITKSKARLDWHPRLNINEALKLTVNWNKACIKKENIQEITLSQIKSYQALFVNL